MPRISFAPIRPALVLVCLWSAHAAAQSTTATIYGHVTDAAGQGMGGVSVTASSQGLQGIRAATTSNGGDYFLPQLPPGAYTVTFERPGNARHQFAVELAPTQVLGLDVSLGVEAAETVTVVGATLEIATRTPQAALVLRQDTLDALPTNRDLNAAVLLAPAVHATGVNGAYSIAGAMSFETLFMINGVPVGDNLRGQPYDLYVEDAIAETSVATSGISAEFGRFGGGVVNVVTKSGGNLFGGSFRDSLVNDRWRALTPFEERQVAADPSHTDTRVDRTVPTYEFTIGGPVVRDRLWFFGAGRYQKQESGRTLVLTNIPYTFETRQRRNEIKGTYAPLAGHRLQGAFLDSSEEQVNQAQNPNNVMDLNSLYTVRRPMNLVTLEYTGALSHGPLFEARVSVRNETLKGVGATTTDLIEGTLLTDRSGRRYWAPTFCGVCAPDQRDGREAFVKGSYLAAGRGPGSHQMTFGYDGYDDRRVADNHQSGSDYRIVNTTVIRQGTTLIPQFIADGSTLIQWNPIVTPSKGTRFLTHSLFYNDIWRVTGRMTANLGVRYDRDHGTDSSGTPVTTAGAFSPRIGVAIAPAGDPTWSVTGNVARYVDGIANLVANAAATGGNPDTYQFAYLGPDINKDPNGPLTPTPDAIRQVFDWFNANGGATRPVVGTLNVVGVSTAIGPDLRPPHAWEYATGVGRQFGARGAIRADLVARRYHDFYALRADTTTGTVVDNRPNAPPAVIGRRYDLSVVENSDVPRRRYLGVSIQGQYRVSPALDTGATYTLSSTTGNIDGETASGPGGAVVSQYPEYKQPAWSYPDGHLAVDQRHRARLWAIYSPGRVPGLTVSALQTLESGVPYGALSFVGVNPQPYVVNPGYVTPPSGANTTYYFTPRDLFRTDGQVRTDIAVMYRRAVKKGGRLEIFGQLQLLNAFDQSQLCGCGAATVSADGGAFVVSRIDQTVLTPVTSPTRFQTFNPFAAAPVRGINWDYGPNFGSALNRFAYTTPRTFRLSFGVRF